MARDDFDDVNPWRAPYAPIDSEEVGEGKASLAIGPDENPWLTIWTRPKATIRRIVDTDPTNQVLLLAALSGISRSLDNASIRNLGDQMPLGGVLTLSAIFGPIGGLLSLYIVSWVLRMTGGWLGGRATNEQVRAAVAWASVPVVVSLLLWIPLLAIFGQEMFTSQTPKLDANPALGVVLLGNGLVEVVLVVWSIVILVNTLGEVHGFSAWLGLAALLLAFLVFLGIVLLIALMVVALLMGARVG